MLQRQSKYLVLRLSSLGDVILATSVLQVLREAPLDWVVSADLSDLLVGHSSINKVYSFRSKQGISAWIRLCRELWNQQYTDIFDLHQSLRTRVMRICFFYWSLRENRVSPRWKSISKEKGKLILTFLFKKWTPSYFRPQKWVEKYARFLGGDGSERPDLKFLAKRPQIPEEFVEEVLQKTPYVCVMPSSRWDGKKWPVLSYFQLLQNLKQFPVILGTIHDKESRELVQLLKAAGMPHYSAIGKWNLVQTAQVLMRAYGYLGGDTGMTHLAEAMGLPVTAIFGPTTPEMGFGPWRAESQVVDHDLNCRPCGKDGRFCYRLTQRYHCLKGISAEEVLQKFNQGLVRRDNA